MSNAHHDNPAGRLALVLEEFRRRPQQDNAAVAWAAVLGAQNDFELYKSLAELAELIEQTIGEIRDLPEADDPDFLLSEIDILQQLPSLFGAAKVHHVSNVTEGVVTEVVVKGLQHCSRALRRSGVRTPTLTSEAIDRLLAEVGEWIAEVSKDETLAVDAKIFVLRRLRDLQDALIGCRLGGFEGVEAAFAAVIGTVVTEPETRRPAFMERCQKFWQNLLSVADGVKQLVGTADEAGKAIDAVRDAF